ncbi:hypothetical protein [Bdellovibrio sp. NC01]|uniref:hypothetical protein n=1 Tax=Bdellovibrio sp. NC01 TaxID=2220073 RepID=UPI001159E767|nr:hypothetical protein [Bdellovibrio sp. NC01]QDK37205.1 hypothetical protein DOE51_06180 [Bdellovibrio sp. NC01]
MAVTTLILGAGASLPYGYPSGEKLVQDIIKRLEETDDVTGTLERLKKVRPYSIDEFINNNPDLRRHLLCIVTEVITKYEDINSLYSVEAKDDIYRKIFNSIPLEKFKDYRIITFNYDRSLEFALQEHLVKRMYRQPSHLIKAKYDELKVIHIHGRMPPLGFETDASSDLLFGYGKVVERLNDFGTQTDWPTPLAWKRAQSKVLAEVWRWSESLNVVYDVGSLNVEAKKILEESTRIFFLGFGYHPLNMLKLGYDFRKVCSTKVIAGTTYGMPRTKLRELKRLSPGVQHLYDCKIVDFLSEEFDLSEPMNDSVHPAGIPSIAFAHDVEPAES